MQESFKQYNDGIKRYNT